MVQDRACFNHSHTHTDENAAQWQLTFSERIQRDLATDMQDVH